MEIRMIIVLLSTFLITLVGTLAYSVRIVGVKTGKIAISFALFNIFVLFSRTANAIKVPMLTKYVENSDGITLIGYFYWIICTSLLATIVGAVMIPTFHRMFSKMVERFSIERSIPRLLLHGFSKNGVRQFKSCIKAPSKEIITDMQIHAMPKKIMVFNIVAVAIFIVSSLAPIYAGVLEPSLRATCLSLTSIMNGLSTVLIFVFIDPYLSILTDDVIAGKCNELTFRKNVVGMVGTNIIGTALALPLLFPASKVIVAIAKVI